jgi:hypothetical protein
VVIASWPPEPPDELVTVTVTVAVVEPTKFVAVSVYVVVALGLTLVELLPLVEVNDPGAIVRLEAPLVVQLSVLVVPEVMLAGLAANEVIVGAELDGPPPTTEVAPDPQPANATHTIKAMADAYTTGFDQCDFDRLRKSVESRLELFNPLSSLTIVVISLVVLLESSYWGRANQRLTER